MYVFKDRVVLDCLHRTVNAYGRIGEYIRIDAAPSRIQFSVVNSSSTVIGRAEFPGSLFTGPGATRTVLLKARALDLVLKRIEVEDVGTLKLRFRVARSGQEQMEVFFVEPNGVSKQFRINCVETVVLPLDFDEVSDRHCTFSCLPAVLKDAFASCEASADEARMQFMPQHISILAKRRGAAGTGASVLNMGLKTIIKLQPTAFHQLTVLTPWQAEFKLKEFRVVLAFLLQLSEETPINAAFDFQGPTTPFVFKGYHPSCPELSFVFKFMARVSTVRNAGVNTWLRVGPQPQESTDWPSSDQGHGRSRHLENARRERAARVRRITTELSAPPSISPLTSQERPHSMEQEPLETSAPPLSLSGTTPSAPASPSASASASASVSATTPAIPRVDPSDGELDEQNEPAMELGFTQAEPIVRGLFD